MRYRSTINIPECKRGESAEFPPNARTAVLVGQGILIPATRTFDSPFDGSPPAAVPSPAPAAVPSPAPPWVPKPVPSPPAPVEDPEVPGADGVPADTEPPAEKATVKANPKGSTV